MELTINVYHHFPKTGDDTAQKINLILQGVNKIMGEIQDQETKIDALSNEVSTDFNEMAIRVESILTNAQAGSPLLANDINTLQGVADGLKAFHAAAQSTSAPVNSSPVADPSVVNDESKVQDPVPSNT